MFSGIKEKLERELREDITDKRYYFGGLALLMAVCNVLLLSRFEALRSLVLADEQSQVHPVHYTVTCSGTTIFASGGL